MSEAIVDTTDPDYSDDCKKTDLMKLSGEFISKINFKMGFLLFFVGMIIFSDIFINGVLSNFNDCVSGECTTTKGTMLQLTVLVLVYLVLDLVVKYDWL
jgi:hypothetical protein